MKPRKEDPANLAQSGLCPWSEPSFGIEKIKCAEALGCYFRFAIIPEQYICDKEIKDPQVVDHLVKRISNSCPHPQRLKVIELVRDSANINLRMHRSVLEELLMYYEKRPSYASK